MKKQIQERLSSKTYRFGLVVLALGYLQQNYSLIDSFFGEYKDAVFFLIGFLILFFREITKEPLSQKSPQK